MRYKDFSFPGGCDVTKFVQELNDGSMPACIHFGIRLPFKFIKTICLCSGIQDLVSPMQSDMCGFHWFDKEQSKQIHGIGKDIVRIIVAGLRFSGKYMPKNDEIMRMPVAMIDP